MELKLLGDSWHRLGEMDPMWAVLMAPDRIGNRWGKDEFFVTGQHDVSSALETVRELRFPLRRGKALDFGCGLGRLTQALACYFDAVSGVDIAPSMIRKARAHNPYGDRCKFFLNQQNDLRLFDDGQFDFVFSLIVLQHMRPDYCKGYIAEFMRVLAPGGLLLFQEPSHYQRKPVHRPSFRYRLRRKARQLMWKAVDGLLEKRGAHDARNRDHLSEISRPKYELREPLDLQSDQTVVDGGAHGVPKPHLSSGVMSSDSFDPPCTETYGIVRREMLAYLKSLGGRVIHVQPRHSDCTPNWPSYRYYVTK